MSGLHSTLAAAAYALLALEQPLALDEIAQGTVTGTFPSAALHTPDWFAAAADSSDLMAMAPELQALGGEAASEDDLPAWDLIHVYAPEMTQPAAAVEPAAPVVADPVEQPRESTRISLLKELSGLDD